MLETLPSVEGCTEGDASSITTTERMWSIQLQMTKSDLEDVLAEEDWEEVGCLQASTMSIILVSRDNLELTVSKTAMDLLTNLGRVSDACFNCGGDAFYFD